VLFPQHLTPLVVSSAHVWLPPELIEETPLVSPATSTGELLGVIEFVPNCPDVLFPQHLTPLVVSSAHVWLPPALIEETPLVSPTTSIGELLSVVEFVPSCPAALAPQHCTPPVDKTAHACELPAEMDSAFD